MEGESRGGAKERRVKGGARGCGGEAPSHLEAVPPIFLQPFRVHPQPHFPQPVLYSICLPGRLLPRVLGCSSRHCGRSRCLRLRLPRQHRHPSRRFRHPPLPFHRLRRSSRLNRRRGRQGVRGAAALRVAVRRRGWGWVGVRPSPAAVGGDGIAGGDDSDGQLQRRRAVCKAAVCACGRECARAHAARRPGGPQNEEPGGVGGPTRGRGPLARPAPRAGGGPSQAPRKAVRAFKFPICLTHNYIFATADGCGCVGVGIDDSDIMVGVGYLNCVIQYMESGGEIGA